MSLEQAAQSALRVEIKQFCAKAQINQNRMPATSFINGHNQACAGSCALRNEESNYFGRDGGLIHERDKDRFCVRRKLFDAPRDGNSHFAPGISIDREANGKI